MSFRFRLLDGKLRIHLRRFPAIIAESRFPWIISPFPCWRKKGLVQSSQITWRPNKTPDMLESIFQENLTLLSRWIRWNRLPIWIIIGNYVSIIHCSINSYLWGSNPKYLQFGPAWSKDDRERNRESRTRVHDFLSANRSIKFRYSSFLLSTRSFQQTRTPFE